MPAKSLESFSSELEVLNRALGAPKGIRIPFPDRKAAMSYRSRLNHARERDRKNNRSIFPDDHPRFGKSYFDELVIRLTEHEGQQVLEIGKGIQHVLLAIEEIQ